MPAHSIWHALPQDWGWHQAAAESSQGLSTWQPLPTSFASTKGKMKCARWTGQECTGTDIGTCTRGSPDELVCSDHKCMCAEGGCYVGGQCVKNKCHVAAAQVAAIQGVGGVTAPMAQEAALRAGKDEEQRALAENPGSPGDVPFGTHKGPGSETAEASADGTGMHNIDATVSLPTYIEGNPVLVGKGKPLHPRPELEKLMKKLFRVSEKLEKVSNASVNTHELAANNEMDTLDKLGLLKRVKQITEIVSVAPEAMPEHPWIIARHRVSIKEIPAEMPTEEREFFWGKDEEGKALEGPGLDNSTLWFVKSIPKDPKATTVEITNPDGTQLKQVKVENLDEAKTQDLLDAKEKTLDEATKIGSLPVVAVLGACLAPALPRSGDRQTHLTKARWSSFFPRAGDVA